MPFTQCELDKEVRRGEQLSSRLGSRTEMRGGDGVMERVIPRKLYMNAVVCHGVDPHDDEYWRDMGRLHPWCKVKYTPRQLKVAMGTQSSLTGRPKGPVNRFGKITYRKVYGRNGTREYSFQENQHAS